MQKAHLDLMNKISNVAGTTKDPSKVFYAKKIADNHD